jgi:hypothetical protein
MRGIADQRKNMKPFCFYRGTGNSWGDKGGEVVGFCELFQLPTTAECDSKSRTRMNSTQKS